MIPKVTAAELTSIVRELGEAKELVNALQLKQADAQRVVTASITVPAEAKKRVQEVLDNHVVGIATEEELAEARQAAHTAERAIEESQELLAAVDRQLLNCVRKYQKTAQRFKTLRHAYFVTILNNLADEVRAQIGDHTLNLLAAAELAGKFNASTPELSGSRVLWDAFFPQGIRMTMLQPYIAKFQKDYAQIEEVSLVDSFENYDGSSAEEE